MGLKSRFCPRCGAEATVSDSMCANCKIEKYKFKLPKKQIIRVCRDCRAISWKGMWLRTDEAPEHYLALLLERDATLPPSARIENLEIMKLGRNGKINVTLDIDGTKFKKIESSDLYVRESRCQDCGNKVSNDHKAILQIRSKEVKAILKYTEKYKENVIKIEDQKNGFDLYLNTKDSARHLANELRKHFKFSTVTTSHRQYSWDRSKNKPKTRINIALRQDDKV